MRRFAAGHSRTHTSCSEVIELKSKNKKGREKEIYKRTVFKAQGRQWKEAELLKENQKALWKQRPVIERRFKRVIEEMPSYFFLSFLGGWDKDSVSDAIFFLLKAFVSSSRSLRFSSTFLFSSWCIRFSCSNFSCSWGGNGGKTKIRKLKFKI